MISVERRLDKGEQQITDLEVDWVEPPPLDWYYGWVDTGDFAGEFYSLDDTEITRFSNNDWRKWLEGEIEGYGSWGIGEPNRDIEWWLEDPEKEPVVVTFDGRYFRIWDGHHRIAAAIDAELNTVPAYVGFEL